MRRKRCDAASQFLDKRRQLVSRQRSIDIGCKKTKFGFREIPGRLSQVCVRAKQLPLLLLDDPLTAGALPLRLTSLAILNRKLRIRRSADPQRADDHTNKHDDFQI
jgi:hypothetical protein